MFDSRWRRIPVLMLVPAAVVVGVAGCGSSAGHAAGASQSAGMMAQTGPFSATELRGALLTVVNGAVPAIPAESGSYSSLPEVKATKQSSHGVSVQPKICASAGLSGFNSSVLSGAPAAAVTFRVGRNGVSEVLAAPSDSVAASALGSQLPAACHHYQATVDGKTFQYAVNASTASGIGRQARVMNVKTVGYASDNVWSIVYRGSGFVGAVTVVGPNASEVAVRELGRQAYAYAAKTLS